MRAPSTIRTCPQSTPWPASSRRTRSPHALAGSAEIQAARMPSRAHAAATFASAPPNWTSSARAVSIRAGDGTESRSSTSPSVTRSCTTPGPLRLAPEADRDRGPEDERGGDGFGAAVGPEEDARGLPLLRPRREAREIEAGRRLARLGVGRDLQDEGGELGPIVLGDVVGPFFLGPLPAHDVRVIPTVGVWGPPAVGVIQHRGDHVVDVEPRRDGQRVVGYPKAPQKEGLALEVVLDPAPVVVVEGLRARLTASHLEPGGGLERRPPPVHEHSP